MDAVGKMVHDVNSLYNITTLLYASLSYHQLALHIRSVLANLWDSLSYIRMFSMHTMDYTDAATTGMLSPHILPLADLKQMLSHIEETLPPTMHLPVSFEDTLHFYRYLCTHILIVNRKFLLLIDIPIHDHIQQLSVHKIFTSDIPHGNFTAQYKVNYSISWNHTGWNYGSSAHVTKLMASFAILMHFFNHLPTLHLASEPYMPRTQPALPLNAHYKSGRLTASAYPHLLLPMSGY